MPHYRMSQILRRTLLGLIVLAALLLLAASFGLIPDRVAYRDRFAEGEEVIERIERYRQQHGRLPVSLREVGVEERLDSPVYYVRRDSGRYEVWFGTTLGESITYRSEKQAWE